MTNHGRRTRHGAGGCRPTWRTGEIRETVEAVLYLESALLVTSETLFVESGARLAIGEVRVSDG